MEIYYVIFVLFLLNCVSCLFQKSRPIHKVLINRAKRSETDGNDKPEAGLDESLITLESEGLSTEVFIDSLLDESTVSNEEIEPIESELIPPSITKNEEVIEGSGVIESITEDEQTSSAKFKEVDEGENILISSTDEALGVLVVGNKTTDYPLNREMLEIRPIAQKVQKYKPEEKLITDGLVQNENETDEQVVVKEELDELEPSISGKMETTERAESEYVPYIGIVKTPTGLCTATLIALNWVVTTSRCISGDYEEEIELYFGARNLEDENKIKINASQLVVNPKYIYGHLDDDIGLIRLAQPLILSERVQIVNIDESTWSSRDISLECTASGYNNGILVKSIVTAARGKDKCSCLSELNFVCIDNNEIESINDAGSPLICNNKLLGVRLNVYQKSKCLEILNENTTEVTDLKNNSTFLHFRDLINKNYNNIGANSSYRRISNLNTTKMKLNQQLDSDRGVLTTEHPNNKTVLNTVSAETDGKEDSSSESDSFILYSNINNYKNWITDIISSDFSGDFIPDEVPHYIGKKMFEILPKSNANYLQNSPKFQFGLLLFQAANFYIYKCS